jgi:Tol biopolymer transport system component
MRRLIVLVTLSVTTLGLVALGGPAQATFPGSNGRIAFLTGENGCCQIATMEPDGSDVRQLTDMGPSYGAVDPWWSPDGSTISFSRQHFEGNFTAQLWVMDADGGNQHRLLPDPFFRDLQPSYSPDGAKIVFTRCRPDFEACAVYRIRADGGGLTALTSMSSPYVADFSPKYSPDGATIVFESHQRGGINGAIFVMNADGSDVRKVTPTRLGAWSPDWSPDGSRIAFLSHCCDPQSSAIWIMNADGTGRQQLTFPGPRHDYAPSFAPDGTKIAFERDAPDFSKFAVWVMNVDGTGLTKISGNQDGEPRWGPAA